MLRDSSSQPASGSMSKSFYLLAPCSLCCRGKMTMGTQLHQRCVKQVEALSRTPKNCNAKFGSCSKTFQNPIPFHFTALPGCPHRLGCADYYGEYQDEGSTVHAFQELLQERRTHMQVTTMNRMNPAKCYPWEQHGGKRMATLVWRS